MAGEHGISPLEELTCSEKRQTIGRHVGRERAVLEIVGIVIAVIAALFVLFHARIRRLPLWAAFGWALATFLFLIIFLPIYLLVHGPEPRQQDVEG